MMKIDFSELESRASFPDQANELFSGLSTAPEFQIPSTDNVSSIPLVLEIGMGIELMLCC